MCRRQSKKILNALECISMIMPPFPFFNPKHPREPKGGKECTNMYNRRYIRHMYIEIVVYVPWPMARSPNSGQEKCWWMWW